MVLSAYKKLEFSGCFFQFLDQEGLSGFVQQGMKMAQVRTKKGHVGTERDMWEQKGQKWKLKGNAWEQIRAYSKLRNEKGTSWKEKGTNGNEKST